MAVAKGKRRTMKKETKSYTKKKSTLGSRSVAINKTIPMFINTRAAYADGPYSLNAGAGYTAGVQVFNISSLYDPDTTGIGHQAMGFDQWGALYNNYVVKGCRFKIYITNSDAGQQIVGWSIQDKATTTSDKLVYMESDTSDFKVVPGIDSGGHVDVMTGYVNLSKYVGRDVTKDDAFEGSNAGNPLNSTYLHVYAVSATGAGDPSPVQITVKFIFDVQYRNPALLASS